MRVVECVPNFSEGRKPEVVADIVAAVTSVQGVRLLDFSSDASHNRSVVTFVGTPEVVEAAAFAGIARARDLIDMEQHHGEHPRLGATDVVPFVPIAGVTMAECVDMARSLGRRVGQELGIPVYLYEKAATRPERRNLADVRRGEYEGLKLTIGAPERAPDFGPPSVHPTAGATVIGARMPLIAFNVNLGTSDVEIAKKIARAVRGSSGGLVYVKALGVMLEDKHVAQVSMNLVNYVKTPIHRVLEMVRREAARYGVAVVETELIGLTPLDAVLDTAAYYLQLPKLGRSQVIEARIWE
ncbi:MAG: glutamate formimidoyltransferase [Firmicutes bacterium]|nr:glutamate formimidoyltransferase [Bacillota bacterium]